MSRLILALILIILTSPGWSHSSGRKWLIMHEKRVCRITMDQEHAECEDILEKWYILTKELENESEKGNEPLGDRYQELRKAKRKAIQSIKGI